MGGRFTFPGGGLYHASKYAIEALSDALRFEVRGFGVDVILVEPGIIRTGFSERAVKEIGGTSSDNGPYAGFNQAVAEASTGVYEKGPLRRLGGPPEAVAEKIEEAITAKRPRARYPVTPSARVLIGLHSVLPDPAWDVVTCMEVLEHCVEAERRRVLDTLRSLVRPGGVVVISVPIEIGPSVAGKQLVRALAGMRNLGDYRHRERYSPIELLQSILGRRVRRVAFEGQGSSGPYQYYGHKGFDYRELAREIAERLTIRQRLFSPMPWLGPALNSQVWFVCDRKDQ